MDFSRVLCSATSVAEVLVFTLSCGPAAQPEHHGRRRARIANEPDLVFLLHQSAGTGRGACDRKWSTRLTTSANTDYVEEGSHLSTGGQCQDTVCEERESDQPGKYI